MLLAIGVSTFWLADSLYLVEHRRRHVRRPAARFDAGWWAGLVLIAAAAWQPPPRARAPPQRREPAADRRAARLRRSSASRCSSTAASRDSTRSRSRLAAASLVAVMIRADADLPRERRDAARLARRGADRRADRARQPPRADRATLDERARRAPSRDRRSCSRCSTSTASSTTTTPSATRPATPCSCGSARNLARLPRTAAASAYRMGGDEFCVLIEPRRRRARAARAPAPPRRCPSTARASAIGCSLRLDPAPERGRGRRRGAADRRPADVRAEARRPHVGRPPEQGRAAAARSPSATPTWAGTSRASPSWPSAPRAGSGWPPRRSSASATPPSCTTSARSRSPTRSSPSPARSTEDEWALRPPPPADRRADPRRRAGAAPRRRARALDATSAGTAAATRTASPATTIPLGARIVAVCDAFDAMTAEPPLPRRARREEALAELRALRRHAVRPARSSETFASPCVAERALRVRRLSTRSLLGSGHRWPPVPKPSSARPLHDRHVAAGARLVPFAGWEMPVQYAGIRDEHLAVRERRRRLRRQPHGRDRDDRARTRRRSCSGSSPTTSPSSPRAARSTRVLCQGGRRRPRRPLHLPARAGPLPDRHQRLQPREGPRVVPAARRRASTSTLDDRLARLRDARRPGPGGARDRRGARRRRAAQALPHRRR